MVVRAAEIDRRRAAPSAGLVLDYRRTGGDSSSCDAVTGSDPDPDYPDSPTMS